MSSVCKTLHVGKMVNVMEDNKYCPDSQYEKGKTCMRQIYYLRTSYVSIRRFKNIAVLLHMNNL